MKSNLFWLNTKDFLKGFLVALLTTLSTSLTLDSNFKSMLIIFISSYSAYLLKNFFTDHNDKLTLK